MSERVGRGYSSTGWSWFADFFDMDNDGDDDLYVVNGVNPYYVYSSVNPYYEDPDGVKRDVVIPVAKKGGNVLFENSNGMLNNVSQQSGVDYSGVSRSAVFLDYDGDGHVDIVLNNLHEPAVVYHNDAARAGNWLAVRLIGDPGKGSTRDAIGASIVVETDAGVAGLARGAQHVGLSVGASARTAHRAGGRSQGADFRALAERPTRCLRRRRRQWPLCHRTGPTLAAAGAAGQAAGQQAVMRRCAFALLLLLASHVAAAPADAPLLWRAFAEKAGSYPIESRLLDGNGRPRHINSLILQASPYLLQHAHNPVDWQAWSEQALASARSAGRPIFLSIGYSTCHWCHTMARESFDNERIARLLNGEFVSIMVDREERPDLDEFFLRRLELMSNSPGWPMTLILTPDGKLFSAASYMPPDALEAHLQRMAKAWKERPRQVERLAASIADKFSALPAQAASAADLPATYQGAMKGLRDQYDEIHHGFGSAPKFPNAPWLQLLLDSSVRDANRDDRSKFLDTLRTVAGSALHDPIDGGFFRYSLTSDWQTPHFEKMLYDQALLARLFAEAWILDADPSFARASQRALDFVGRRLQRSDGLFFSAMDAQSEGRPGAYYLWQDGDLAAAFDATEQAAIAAQFRSVVQPEGGLLLLPLPAATGKPFEAALARLTMLRQRRPAPFVDRKAITGWNAMMIESFARCGELFGEPRYVEQAARAMRGLLKLHRSSVPMARFSAGKTVHGAITLEDSAHLMSALAALHGADGSGRWHDEARRVLPDILGSAHADADNLRLFARDRELPAATAVLIRALNSLYLQSADPKFRDAMQALAPTARSILAADGLQNRASLAAALYLPDNPLPRKRALLARGHVRAELTGSRPVGDSGRAAFVLSLHIDPGWHVNSARPVQDYLIPLRIGSTTRPDVAVVYPPGKLVKLGFERSELSVYEGDVTIRGTIETAAGGGLRSPLLQLTLQACTDRICLPPDSVPLDHIYR